MQKKKNITQVSTPAPVSVSAPTPKSTPNASNPALPGIAVPGSESTMIKQEKAVGKLLDILPYSDANFSFSYSYSKNVFTLILRGSDSKTANRDFDTFLQKNGVMDRTWIQNLEIFSQSSTPAP